MASEGQKKIREMCKNILLDRISKTRQLPWESPLKCFNSFNWVTGNTYRGINRVILPFGEYLTSRQLVEYNKKHGTDYRYDKDSTPFYPVVFSKMLEDSVVFNSLSPDIQDKLRNGEKVPISSYSWLTYKQGSDTAIKHTHYMQYSVVVERSFCINSQGMPLPSRIKDTHEVEITYSNLDEILQGYIKKEGIALRVSDYPITAAYAPGLDEIRISSKRCYKSSVRWYSSLAHECGHSTGVPNRLNRKQLSQALLASRTTKGMVTYVKSKPEYKDLTDVDEIAKAIKKVIADIMNDKGYEECVAEFTASFLLAECGVEKYECYDTSDGTAHVAYLQGWQSYLQDPSTDIIRVINDADKAFNYILSATQEVE